jgi:hypothetical protein
VSWVKNQWPGALLIAREQIIIQLYPDELIWYLYPATAENSYSEELIVYLADNWYRASDGSDQVEVDGFSVPQVLTGSIRIGLAMQTREYEAVEHWCSQLSKIHVSNSENDFIKRALDNHRTMVEYYDPPNDNEPFSRWLEERKLRDYLALNRYWTRPALLRGIYFLQRCLFKKTREIGKIIFSDWTDTYQMSGQKCLWTNNKDLRKSAMIFTSRSSLIKSTQKVNLQIVSFTNGVWISNVLKRENFSVSDQLADLLAQYLDDCVSKNKSCIILYHAQITMLFKNYNVKSIQIPAELFEPYVVAMQLAKVMGFQCTLSVDGHDPTGRSLPTLRMPDNKSYLLDRFVVQSEALYSSALQAGFTDNQIVRTNSKLLSLQQVQLEKNTRFDAIVMTWIPNHQNPNARIDSPSTTLESSLKLLSELFVGKIAVKVKDFSRESDYVCYVINNLGLSERVEVITGRFHDHINSTSIIVGGISSAIAECKIHDVPYIIYEPIENGYGEMYFEGNYLLKRSRIARTVAELESLIALGEPSVDIDREEYLFSSGRIN